MLIMYSSSRKTSATKVNPITSKVNPSASRVNSLTSKVNSITSDYISMTSKGYPVISYPSTSKVNPSTSKVNPTSSKVNPTTSKVNRTVSKVNPTTSKVNPTTSKINSTTSKINPTTSRVNPISSRVNPISSRVNPISSKVNPITSKVNPITSRVNRTTSKVNPITSMVDAITSYYIPMTSKVNGSISRENSSTSGINTTTSRVNASTSRVNSSTSRINTTASRVIASTSGESISRFSKNSQGMNSSTSRPNLSASRPNPATSRVNLVTSKVNKAITTVIPTVRFYEPSSHSSDIPRKSSHSSDVPRKSSHSSDIPRKSSVDSHHELLCRKSDQTKKHSVSRVEPVSFISSSSSKGLTSCVSDTKGDSRHKDIRPSVRRHSISDISISGDSSLGGKGVRKCFVRHSESDAPPNVIVTRIHSPEHVARKTESHVNTDSNSHPITTSSKVYKSRYAVPELYSTLTVAKAIKEDKIDESKHLKKIPASTMKRINKKASHQLNFSPDDQLFKGLINLDINDDVVKKPPKRVVRPKLKRHNVPNLSDYYIPEFLGEFPIQNKAALRPIGKLKYWDGLTVNQRCLAWEEELFDSKDVEGSESDES